MNLVTRAVRFSAFKSLLGALACLALFAAAPVAAGAAGTGSISGTVTDVADDPVESVCVWAYDSAGDGLNYVSTAETDANGDYTLEDLETGNHKVRFRPCQANVLGEWFDDEENFAGATQVPVVDGADTPDIDAELGTGGSISGRVLNVPGGSNAGTCVEAYGTGIFDSNYTQTDASGNYRIVGLETGDYRVRFNRCGSDENVAAEYYPDKATRPEATPVSVTAGSDTPDIDAQLEQGVTISGTISGGGPTFAPYLCFSETTALGADGVVLDTDTAEFSSATPPGILEFKLERLKPGNQYFVSTTLGCGWVPVGSDSYSHTEYYRDAGSLAGATPISVNTGSAVTGIDIKLETPDPDVTPPDTVIDSGPTGSISADEATFAFSSTDPANTGGFECRLDSGDYAACDSPATLSSLSEGEHTFYVRAKHAVAGVQDQTPASRTFSVDSSRPVMKRARIGKVSVKGQAKVKKGNAVTYRVRITNSGKAAARGVKLRVRGSGTRAAASAGSIPAGKTKSVRIRFKPKRVGESMITVRVGSSNAGGKSVKRRLVVKR